MDTESLLTKALEALKEAYASPNDASLIQKRGPPAPEGFSEYRQNEAGTGVVMMIEQIITDTQNLQKAAKDSYTAFKEETSKSVEQKLAEVVNKNGQKSK